jgi:hypothetical protein
MYGYNDSHDSRANSYELQAMSLDHQELTSRMAKLLHRPHAESDPVARRAWEGYATEFNRRVPPPSRVPLFLGKARFEHDQRKANEGRLPIVLIT